MSDITVELVEATACVCLFAEDERTGWDSPPQCHGFCSSHRLCRSTVSLKCPAWFGTPLEYGEVFVDHLNNELILGEVSVALTYRASVLLTASCQPLYFRIRISSESEGAKRHSLLQVSENLSGAGKIPS